MRNLKSFALMTAFFMAVPAAYADDAFVKLGRGVVNVVTSPLEYPVQYMVLEEEHNAPVALISTVLYGTLFTVTRILGGAYEIVTFPIPLPRNYEPLMHPPTPVEAFTEMQGKEEE